MSEFIRHYTKIQEYRTDNQVDTALAYIQIKSHTIRILIWESSQNNLLAFDEIQFTRPLNTEEQIAQFQHFLPESGLSGFPVRQVRLIYEPGHFVLVPAPLWDEKNALDYLLQTGEPAFDFRILEQTFGEGHHLVYALPLAWKNWADQLFESSEIQWLCSLIPFIYKGMEMCPPDKSMMLACIENEYMFGLAFRGGSLQFLNRFEFKTENDLLYFTLLTAETAGANPAEDRLLLCGNLLPSSLGFEKLNRYFGNTEFISDKTPASDVQGAGFLRHSVYFDLMMHLSHQKT